MQVPDVSYTRSGDVAIAYQVLGHGPLDLVFVPFIGNIYTPWLLPPFAAFMRSLAAERRLIVINPRGVGLSDRPRGFTVESRMDDLVAVMDAVRSEHAAVLGIGEAAATCAVFAASYPERVDALLLFAPYARVAETTRSVGPRSSVCALSGRAGGRESSSSRWHVPSTRSGPRTRITSSGSSGTTG